MSPTLQNALALVAWRSGLPALALGLALNACADPANTPVTGSLATAERVAATSKSAGAPVDVAAFAAAHKANPVDAATALAYARALRAGGAKAEALAVLDKAAAAAKPADRRLQLERGLLALDLGETAKAEKLLRQAHDPKAPDWRVHSALGAALASRGMQQEAQAQFAKALALAPDHPTVLNNLALSYALDGKVAEAEKLLRKAQPGAAQAPPQMQQNLALVLGLRGKYDEARVLGEAALPPAKAGDNVDYLKRLASAKSAANRADGSEPAAKAPAKALDRKANASLPQPAYQLGRSPSAD